ncbi:hypothetical protein SDRG_13879 [Saprolegnia diclina VS20]|uniref:Rubisco LSMT substrate-binding domain-containing protein n=1 Tax=Saprolegnia diclina (strain VS20) TaxID=1156394 RepID=T0Q1A4_SAPDV|nr:hypothetical protein SDRG_13879 [Saprolegnia diclina VS20]EQC28331.1 hypothetical protein SDRG_13879 [Saprolegnia diclina VS20]|eukprot:XP_008618201.1 hypothetical protein SDRG_13879 [Saprolegnia diclina VS20]
MPPLGDHCPLLPSTLASTPTSATLLPPLLSAPPRLPPSLLHTPTAAAAADLRNWLLHHQVDLDRVAFGAGAVAQTALTKGATSLAVPFALTMNVHSARSSDLAPLLQRESTLLDNEVLVLHLVYERLKGDASFWAPFLRSLPASFDTPIYWSHAEFHELKGTNVAMLTNVLRQQLVADYTTIYHRICLRYPQMFPLDRVSIGDFKWALSVLSSRAFGITKDGEYLQVLCPGLDQLTHDVNLHVPLDEVIVFDASTQTLEHHVHDAVAAGAPLTISYGPYSNAKLLCAYGFVVPGNLNCGIDFWLDIPRSDRYFRLKKALLDSNALTAAQTYDFEGTLLGHAVSERLLATVRIIRMHETEIDAHNNAFKSQMISRSNEMLVYDSLIAACRQKLQSYTCTLKQDDALLASGMAMGNRLQMALQVRMEEKRVLVETIETLNQWSDYLMIKQDTDTLVYPPHDVTMAL